MGKKRNGKKIEFADQLYLQLYEIANEHERGLSSTSRNKFEQAEASLAEQLGLRSSQVLFQYSGDKKNFHGRIRQAQYKESRLSLIVFISPETDHAQERARDHEFPADVVLILNSPSKPTSPSEIVTTGLVGMDGPILQTLHSAFPNAQIQTISASEDKPMPAPLQIDARIRRMILIALRSTPAVLLVGPPGTGKSSLLRELITEIQQNPHSIGHAAPPSAPKWVTAEEGWTTRELVGGETVDDDHRLRFALGHVLDAIRENRWLVIDEVNRADMDKIFGALMTWLGQRRPAEYVDLGRSSTAPDSAMVQLGWSSDPDCSVEGLERLAAEDSSGEPIRFLAGTSWRLLGTYNAVDAHRVFRFGHALGRRFVRIPVPPPGPEDFSQILESLKLDDAVQAKIQGLYDAHFHGRNTQLGPALFVTALEYVCAALAQGISLDNAVAEGYLVAFGSWLARIDEDDAVDLGTRLVDSNVVSTEDWEWIGSLLPALG